MDWVFICRDGLENSVIGNVAMAVEAAKAGSAASVLFTEEALAALCGGSLDWSRALRDRDSRISVSRVATKMGFALASTKDDRWTDIWQFLRAAAQKGVKLYACALWAPFLGLSAFPDPIKPITMGDMLAMLRGAGKVIGGF